MSSPYRVKNDRGGHDLTADGWKKAVELAADQLEKTKAVADAAVFGRQSPGFIAAHRAWSESLGRALAFYTTGHLPN